MNERIKKLYKQAAQFGQDDYNNRRRNRGPLYEEDELTNIVNQKFAELIVQECIDKIETHQIPVGNSAAGEMACEWTYGALKEIRNEIKQHFGVEE